MLFTISFIIPKRLKKERRREKYGERYYEREREPIIGIVVLDVACGRV